MALPTYRIIKGPSGGGYKSAETVERTARVLVQEGCKTHVRTTITKATLGCQAEIADYLCRKFSPLEIHFEPIYSGGRASVLGRLTAQDAGEFVENFIMAQKVALQNGCVLTTSGSRPGSIHGPYCNVFRSVVNLVPGGVATACFKSCDAADVKQKGVGIGALNPQTGLFELDHSKIRELRHLLRQVPKTVRRLFCPLSLRERMPRCMSSWGR